MTKNRNELRDWFAGQALAGIEFHDQAYNWSPESMAIRAYRIAEAMMKERDSHATND